MGVWIDVVWREGSLAFGIPAAPAAAQKLVPTDDPNAFVVDRFRSAGERIVFEMIAEARRRAKDVSSFPKFVVCEAHHIVFPATLSMLREPIESYNTLQIRAWHLRKWFVY